MLENRPRRRKLFGPLGVIAGGVLLAFEMARPADPAASAVEQWFWVAVAVGLIGLGLAEMASSPRKE